MSVRERSAAGLSHIPEDRHRRGLVREYSVGDNLILGLQRRFSVTVALPRLVGGDGVIATFPQPLSDEEQAALQRSATIVRDAITGLNLK